MTDQADELWHYIKDGKSSPPLPQSDIISLIEKKEIAQSVLVWKKGSDKWIPADQVFNLEGLFPPPLPGSSALFFNAPWLKNSAQWNDIPPRPWIRYFARILDTIVNGLISLIVFIIVLNNLLPDASEAFVNFLNEPQYQFANAFFVIFFSMFLNAAFIGFTGRSLGKFFWGIKVTNDHGGPLGYKAALKREFHIWLRGFGLGIPIVSLFTLIASYKTLKSEKETSWDHDLKSKVLYLENNWFQILLKIIGTIILVVTISVLNNLD